MQLNRLFLASVLFSALVGCGATLEPRLTAKPLDGFDLVDMTKVDLAGYQKDFADCASLANQDVTDVQRMAAGAVGAVADRATLGVIGGKTSKHADRATVLKRCLTGRGYNVLR